MVVNPGTEARALALHQPVEVMQPYGGGVLSDRASTGSWGLRWQRASSLTVPAHG